jgi:hypothetical protein
MHSFLLLVAYLDQFCFSVSCVVVSSLRQAFLSRPRTTDPRAAALQIGPTWADRRDRARFVLRPLPSRALGLWLAAGDIGRLFLLPSDIGRQIL